MPLSAYTISGISKLMDAELIKLSSDCEIKFLLLDSRRLSSPDNSLFFAIKGARNDGHKFIADLYQKGIRNFVVSEVPEIFSQLRDCTILKVPDTLLALQKLAEYHRNQFQIPVLGITGSNGKTIVKEWLFQLLREDKNIVRSPKSYNSQVGVPLSVWEMQSEHELAIFEAGISQPNEMHFLHQIIRPTLGLLTNIGQAHSENFTSEIHKVQEKLKLFEGCESLIYCKDYTVIHEQITHSELFSQTRLFSWSRKSKADLQIGRIEKLSTETKIQGIYNNDFLSITIPFMDDAYIENAIQCWAFMLLLGYNNRVIEARMHLLSPVAMRLELKEGMNNCSIINDSYNSDLGSLSIALDFLNQQKQHNKRTVILSDILQSGKDEASLYKEVADLLQKKKVHRLIGIGEAISRQAKLFSGEKSFYFSTSEFLNRYNTSFFRDETILLKGARAFGFEQISKLLQQKAHETVLEINLNAFVHNLNYYRSIIDKKTKLMAMVKAFSYGSGSFEIANILQFHRIDYLAVAYADEGIELRKAGITTPIMVMNPEEQSFDAMLNYELEPEIYSFRMLGIFSDVVKRIGKPTAIHIKLDTGMHRLGFEEKDVPELIVRIKNNKYLLIKSVFSHLAASDEKEHDTFTRNQIDSFTQMSAQFQKHFEYPILRHILNSSGIARFGGAQFEMVRLGIGMYGISANDYEQMNLQNVSTLKTIVSQIKLVSPPDTVGYSRKGVLSKPTRIATVPIGYADGYNRKLGNGVGKMIVGGQVAPTVGSICMDMCMLDVTDLNVNEGDEVIVFGDAYSIAQMAKDMGTIPYEVLTNVSRRVKRIYYQE
ncbi:MAG: bifunctional UDP-N-acetylmuramoyl-tripeptide:D-alanyl-D-alanine ligase/alanine racemase [Bacteroidetes bacterium]|nr:bifunctional UDP-N-acetylmuramoyl-tripeptide:D-alanyl-D-alanine ligase/alanine racemase [Bacteroidota bacterium]